MRKDILNCLNWYFDFVVSFLAGCEKYLQGERLIGIQFLFGRIETQLLLVFFRNVDTIGHFGF